MFQNINESTIDDKNYKVKNNDKRKIEILSNLFAIKNIPIYIISVMVSMVGITGGSSPFSISILGACLVNSIPALGVVISCIIGSSIKFGLKGVLRICFNSSCYDC